MTLAQINAIVDKNEDSKIVKTMKVVSTDNSKIEALVKIDGILHRYTKASELKKAIKKFG